LGTRNERIDTLEISLVIIKIHTKLVDIISNNMPGFLEEIGIKPIRPRGLVIRQFLYYTVDFILAKRNAKVVNCCKE
jgi:hypothetical protein